MKKLILLNVLLFLFLASCGDDAPKQKKTTSSTPPKKEVSATKVNEKVEPAEVEEEEAPKEEVQDVVYPPEQLKKAKELIANATEEAIAAVDAKKKFKQFCAACHGFTGDLNVNGAKDLTASKIPLEESIAQIYHGRGLMTPFKGLLKDDEIVAVAKYIEKELRK